MLVPFPIFYSVLRDKAALECNNFLIRLPNMSSCHYEFANGKSVRVTGFFDRVYINRSKELFPCIGILLKMPMMMRMYSKDSLNHISNLPEMASPPALARSMMAEKLLEDRFQLFLSLGLFLVQTETSGL
jgi:hypothetical protein